MPAASRHHLLFLPILVAVAACHAQTAPATALQTYTAPDQTASAGVPSGWKVTSAAQTVIQMTGPQGETVSLGTTVVAQNGAVQPGQRPANGIDLSMPYATPLAQKLAIILQQGSAAAGKPLSLFTVTAATPLQLPAAIGQCGRFVASYTGPNGATKLLAVMCSLPMDVGGAYKNILLLATAPAATAAQSAPVAQAIFQSYKIPPAWLQKKLAPHGVAAPMPASAGGINGSTINGIIGANTSANCFDLGVIRQTPTRDLPKSCGGTKPD